MFRAASGGCSGLFTRSAERAEVLWEEEEMAPRQRAAGPRSPVWPLGLWAAPGSTLGPGSKPGGGPPH